MERFDVSPIKINHLAFKLSNSGAMGVNIRTVFRWLADFSMGGQSALLAKPIPGRPTKLSADEMSWIAKTVKDHTPQQFGARQDSCRLSHAANPTL
jgi:transposase